MSDSNTHTCARGISTRQNSEPCKECARTFWRGKSLQAIADPEHHLERWRSDEMIVESLAEFADWSKRDSGAAPNIVPPESKPDTRLETFNRKQGNRVDFNGNYY